MKKALLISLVIFMAVSCEKYNNTCDCKNPLEDLPWLKDLKDSFTNCTCRISIVQAEYNHQTVFYSILNDELCDGIPTVILKDCSGNSLKTYANGWDETFTNEVKDRRIIYSCKTPLVK
jgi:hypothetical protein